jgi:hypothetical protein
MGPADTVTLIAAGLVLVLGAASTALGTASSSSTASTAVQYFRFLPGTPTEDQSGVFHVPEYVLGEPAGAPANLSEVRQAWEDLTVLYLNDTPALFANWSVPSFGPGRFDLRLQLTPSEIGVIESGQAVLALNSSVVVGGEILGAAGLVDGTVLSSSIVLGAWWNNLFDIETPPPSTDPRTLGDVIDDLAWFGGSTAGRALYAAVTLSAVLLYVYEGQRLAKERLVGRRNAGAAGDRE